MIVEAGKLIYCNWVHPDCEAKYHKTLGQSNIPNNISNLEDKEDIERNHKVIEKTFRQLDEYFLGKRKEFDLPLELRGTDFQKRVWQELQGLKYGQTVGYKDLAQKCGMIKGFQAIAGACGANPLAVIVPCHRVVNTNGTIGGYTGGIEKKKALLKLETENLY